MKRSFQLARLILLLAVGIAIVPPAAAVDRLKLVATTPDFAALAQAVGGDAVSIKTLAKPTEDPHFVDARPTHVVALNRADALIESGADLEIGWLPSLVEGARNKGLLPGAPGRLLGAEGISLLDIPTTLDRSHGDVHSAGNPHFLMDPDNARIAVAQLAKRFCALTPASCPAFETNRDRFVARLDAAETRWQARLAPFKGHEIVTYHNTWRYFARKFELKADTFLEPKPGIPPSPPHLAKVIRKMQAEKIKVILVEPFQSRKTAEAVASHAQATVVNVCQFPGGLDGTEDDYIALMQANVDAIAHALGG